MSPCPSMLPAAAILSLLVVRGALVDYEVVCESWDCVEFRNVCKNDDKAASFKCFVDMCKDPQKTCRAAVKAHETWQINHYCVSTDGSTSGWGFKAPVAAFVEPDQVSLFKLEAILSPTTSQDHIFQKEFLDVRITMVKDKPESSFLRTCRLEAYSKAGTASVMSKLASAPSGGKRVSLTLGRLKVPESYKLLMPDELAFVVSADAKSLANDGPVPPALDSAQLTLHHVLNFPMEYH